MLYNALFTLVIAIMSNSAQGCHSGLRKRSLTIRAQAMTSFFSRCLSDSAGKDFRWQAITRFAIEDTTWYDETSSRFCRGLRDTDECWRGQLDFFVNPYSKYSHHIKRCIREYASKGSRSLPHFAFDESLQSARTGRWKRTVFGQPLLHRRRIVRPKFVPPALTTRTAVAPRYVPPRQTGSPPSQNGIKPPTPRHPVNPHPSPPVHHTYYGNRRLPFQSNSGGNSPQHSTVPFKSTKTPTARSQTTKSAPARAKFTDLSRVDQLYVSILQNYHQSMMQQASTPVTTTYRTSSSVLPFASARACDQSSRSRFEGCVNSAVDDSIEPHKRLLMLDADTGALSKVDLRSIFRFFRQSYSPCMDEKVDTPIRICSVTQVRSFSSSAVLCLPSIMVRLVRRDSELRKLFLSCASRNS